MKGILWACSQRGSERAPKAHRVEQYQSFLQSVSAAFLEGRSHLGPTHDEIWEPKCVLGLRIRINHMDEPEV